MAVISLDYGAAQHWTSELKPEQLVYAHTGPQAVGDPLAAAMSAITQPLEFPSLHQAVVPDDRVVIVVDRQVPAIDEVLAATWHALALGGVDPARVLILQPAALTPEKLHDPRGRLPADVRECVEWRVHDPTAPDATGYLASSAAGERLYLAREILDADFVLPIGRFGYDAMLGRRELTSSFYPGLSTPGAFAKSIGQGHSELGPDDERPLRQLVHEIAWLLGIQFTIQVLPAANQNQAAAILAGNTDAVAKQGRSLLDQSWRVTLDQRGETAVIALPGGHDETTWTELGAALQAAQKLIVRGGRIVVLSDLAAEPGPGIDLIRNSRSAKAALQPLRKAAPPDVLAAAQIAAAADWATVYLLSQLDSRVVEETFLTPLDQIDDVTRLLPTCDGCIVLAGAQHIYSEIRE